MDLQRDVLGESLRYRFIHGNADRLLGPHEAETFISRSWLSLVFTPSAPYHCHHPDGSVDSARDGQVVVIPAGRRHRFAFAGEARLCGIFIHYTMLGGSDVLSLYRVPVVIGGKVGRRIGRNMIALCRGQGQAASEGFLHRAQQQVCAWQILEDILAVSELDEERLRGFDQLRRLRPALDVIHRDLQQDLCRDDLAALVNLSAARFNRLFHDLVGQPPMTYLRERRFERAEELLLQSALSIEQVATAVGYGDPYHFSKQFKLAKGLSPLHFRQQMLRLLEGLGPQ